MDWNNLRVFLAVARAGQFLSAARHLKLDHATVGRRITALERSLHARLLDRRTTGVLLTEAGQRLLAAAERIETEVLQASAALSNTDVQLSGNVRIGAPDGLSTYYVAGLCADLLERHPAITVQLVPTPQAIAISRREVDIAIVLEKPEAGRFVTRKLTDYSLGIFATRAYIDRRGIPLRPGDLKHHRLVGYVEDFIYSPALNYVRELFEDTPTNFQCASAVGQLEAVRAGLGLGVVHHFVARSHDDLVPIFPERRALRSYWIVEHKDTRGLGRIRAVHDFLLRSVERDRVLFIDHDTME